MSEREGNAAKLREALEKADRALSRISKSAWFMDANFGETVEVVEAGKAIRQALSAESTCKEPLSVESITTCNGLQESCKQTLQGNGAGMREALSKIKKISSYYDDSAPNRKKLIAEICDLARIALAEPPRNCDRFADEEATQIVFLNEVWLIDVTTRYDYPFYCWTNLMKCRFIEWLFAEAKGETK